MVIWESEQEPEAEPEPVADEPDEIGIARTESHLRSIAKRDLLRFAVEHGLVEEDASLRVTELRKKIVRYNRTRR